MNQNGRPQRSDWQTASVLHPDFGPVRLRNPEGSYLSQGKKGFAFIANPDRALIFEFEEGEAQRIVALFAEEDIQLTIEYVEDFDVYEVCDKCHEMQLPHDTFFNGQSFLCFDCKILSAGVG